jgi:hypothetical protein
MGPFWVTVPVQVSKDPERGGVRYCIIDGKLRTFESEDDALDDARRRHYYTGADLVLIFLEASHYGFHYVGRVGFTRSTNQFDFPGDGVSCESTIESVKSKLSELLDSRVSIRS